MGATMSIAATVHDLLENHHALLHRELPRLNEAFKGMKLSPAFLRPWTTLISVSGQHTQKEEAVFFPNVLALEEGDHGHPPMVGAFRQMEADHALMRGVAQQLRTRSGDVGPETAALLALLDDLEVHLEKEEEELYPAVRIRLHAEHLEELDHQLSRERGELAVALARAIAAHANLSGRILDLDARIEEAHLSPRVTAPWAHFARGMHRHMGEEELHLFPALQALADGGSPPASNWEAHLHEMQFELDEVRTIADALRNAAQDTGELERVIVDLLDTVEAHAAAEEGVLFPRAMRLLEDLSADAEELEQPPPEGNVLQEILASWPGIPARQPSRVVRQGGEIRLESSTPEHGLLSRVLSRHPEHFEGISRFEYEATPILPQGDPELGRMVGHCVPGCPTCAAKAAAAKVDPPDLSGLRALLSERRGVSVELIVAHVALPIDLERQVKHIHERGNIAGVYTHGLSLDHAEAVSRLARAGVDEVVLTFESMDDAVISHLRGAPLLRPREAALDELRRRGVPTTLVVPLIPTHNEEELGRILRFALDPDRVQIRDLIFLDLREPDPPAEVLPERLLDLLAAEDLGVDAEAFRSFNRITTALLHANHLRRCRYVEHFVLIPDAQGGHPLTDALDLPSLEAAVDRYGAEVARSPVRARASFFVALARGGVGRDAARVLTDLARKRLAARSGGPERLRSRAWLPISLVANAPARGFDPDLTGFVPRT